MKERTIGDFLSPSRIAVECARLWDRSCPFERLRNLPVRCINRGLHWGLLHPIWFDVKPGIQMKLDMRDVIQQTLLMVNVWDPGVTEFVLQNLKPGMVFLDIGANVGYFSLLTANHVAPSGRVIAVEPNPLAFSQLEQNIKRNKVSNITVLHAACADSAASGKLYVSGPSNTGKASFSSKNAESQEFISVDCLPGDTLIEKLNLPRLDLVKIDVEGAELRVLKGLARSLAKWRPKLIMEVAPQLLKNFSTEPDEILDFVRVRGYSILQSKRDADYTDYLFGQE